MSGGLPDPHDRQRREAARARERGEAEERLHLEALMESAGGTWLLGDIIAGFEAELQRRTTGHNSDDSYHRGKQDAAKKYRDLIIRHFGHSGIDRIMKGAT